MRLPPPVAADISELYLREVGVRLTIGALVLQLQCWMRAGWQRGLHATSTAALSSKESSRRPVAASLSSPGLLQLRPGGPDSDPYSATGVQDQLSELASVWDQDLSTALVRKQWAAVVCTAPGRQPWEEPVAADYSCS